MVGVFLDIMSHFVGKERAYLFLPVWLLAFGLPSYLLLFKLYQSWKRYGGDDAYVAPMLEKHCADDPLPCPLPEILL
jgi:hypothetical protein